MSATIVMEQQTAAAKARRAKQAGGAALGQDTSREARRVAATILEVLAGARTPAEAATALNISAPRYYQLESRALQGLLAACETGPQGRMRSPEREARTLRQANERLQREVARQQALVRMAQRTMGLPPPPAAPATRSGKKTRKRRVARALSVAKRLHQDQQEATKLQAESSKSSESSSAANQGSQL